MNKKEFLKELEKRLHVLAQAERNDIIEEYRDTIEEKIKHGQTEEQAVADFGSIEELAREILSAYKINPDYGSEEEIGDKARKVLKDGESLIKQCAKKMSDFTKGVIEDIKKNDQEITVEFIFEIIIKALIFLVICALLRIPFWLIQQLGISILNIFFPPIDTILGVLWAVILGIIYFLICVFIAIAMFREYFHSHRKESSVDSKKESVAAVKSKKEESSKTTAKSSKKKEIAEVVPEEKVTVKTATKNNSGDVVLLLLRIFVGIFLLLPLGCLLVLTWIGIAFSVYYLWRGLPIVGILILLLGAGLLLNAFIDIFYRLVFSRKKVYVFPVFVAFILLIIGGVFTAHTVLSIDYHDAAPLVSEERTEKEYTEKIERVTHIDVNHGTVEIIADENIAPGVIHIKVYYFDRYTNYVYYRDQSRDGNTDYIRVQTSQLWKKAQERRKLYDLVIDNLKDKKVYDYRKLQDVEVKVYVNEQTKSLLR